MQYLHKNQNNKKIKKYNMNIKKKIIAQLKYHLSFHPNITCNYMYKLINTQVDDRKHICALNVKKPMLQVFHAEKVH